MNNKEKQKKLELEFILNFLKHKNLIADDIIQLISDPPDFILTIGGECIGVEIVELWPLKSSKPITSAYHKVIRESELKFNSLSKSTFKLSFTFNGFIDISEKKYLNFASLISNWVFNELDSKIDSFKANKTIRNPIPEIPQLIEINNQLPLNNESINWQLSREVSFCIPIKDSEIRETIINKEQRIKAWNTNYSFDEKWLLIVLTEDPQSTFLNQQQTLTNWGVDGLFDKIFFFDNFMREIIIPPIK